MYVVSSDYTQRGRWLSCRFEPLEHRSIKNWEYVDDSYFTNMYGVDINLTGRKL
jgi:hypothetical protein